MKRFVFIFFCICIILPGYSQLGGTHSFDFLNLNTNPRSIALGGYIPSVIDGDINIGIYNPSLINPLMINNIVFNYTPYYADIIYGNVGYGFNFSNINFLSSLKFINYGELLETNEFGQEIGYFNAGEYVFSLGVGKLILDSLLRVGVNYKMAYSSLYDVSSLSVLFDFAATYRVPYNDILFSLIIKNLGYQLIPYYAGNRESLPFEILLGFSNKLKHVPLRWHLTFQHLEQPDLNFNNSNSQIPLNNNFGYSILKHIVLGAEILFHQNVSLFLGYNNRKRVEMSLEERRGLVGFSCGFLFKIQRFQFSYSRNLHHYSNPINSFGIITNLSK